jgi:HAD superfamily hydrolase (TIGR01509 family)
MSPSVEAGILEDKHNPMSLPPILLDLGGVTFQATGTSNKLIDWSVISPLNNKYGGKMSVGDVGLPTFLAEYNAATNQELTDEEFLEAIWDTLEMNTELVDFLKDRYEIIIVSDNYRENIEYVAKRFDFASWASQEFYSYDYGILKEEPAFFERLVNELPYPPEELTLIDDSPHKLAAAATVGIKGVLYRDVAGVMAAMGGFQ